ncbi:flavodoxin domain-containing protein [Clostridium nigeriense]|uniref:flavodoxin domain-containing protein n=1 Tax=Clostridium nigeriense TaxID=1805470 RepID=UPI00082DEBAA|nr:flavodoxin domain-containing protein [Clostridium nigeriense]
MKTLIVYSSKYGCTKKCSELLKKELKDEVNVVNLNNTKDIDLNKYHKVIIGGSIYIGQIRKEVKEFCSKNLEILKGKKIALFICCMQEGEAIDTTFIQNFPKELIDTAIIKESFGGEFNFFKMNFFERFIVKKIAKVSSDKSNILTENISKFARTINYN